MFKETLKIIRNRKMRNYKFKYIKGFIGLFIGLYYYFTKKRYKENYRPMAYASFFVVRQIQGFDPK